MVSRPGGSRPAELSQRHVDALARGHADEEALRLIRAARTPAPPEAEGEAAAAPAEAPEAGPSAPSTAPPGA
jgi:hypothetical protein